MTNRSILPDGTCNLEIDINAGAGVQYDDGRGYIKLSHDGAAIFVRAHEDCLEVTLTTVGARRLASALIGFADMLEKDDPYMIEARQ